MLLLCRRSRTRPRTLARAVRRKRRRIPSSLIRRSPSPRRVCSWSRGTLSGKPSGDLISTCTSTIKRLTTGSRTRHRGSLPTGMCSGPGRWKLDHTTPGCRPPQRMRGAAQAPGVRIRASSVSIGVSLLVAVGWLPIYFNSSAPATAQSERASHAISCRTSSRFRSPRAWPRTKRRTRERAALPKRVRTRRS